MVVRLFGNQPSKVASISVRVRLSTLQKPPCSKLWPALQSISNRKTNVAIISEDLDCGNCRERDHNWSETSSMTTDQWWSEWGLVCILDPWLCSSCSGCSGQSEAGNFLQNFSQKAWENFRTLFAFGKLGVYRVLWVWLEMWFLSHIVKV